MTETLALHHRARVFDFASGNGLLLHEFSGRRCFRPRPPLCQSGRIDRRFLSGDDHSNGSGKDNTTLFIDTLDNDQGRLAMMGLIPQSL